MSPQKLVKQYLLRDLRQDAKVAAMILRACPEFITDVRPDETVDRYLRRIGAGTIRDDAVEGITGRSRVNGSWRILSLEVRQRHALAAELDRFAAELGRAE